MEGFKKFLMQGNVVELAVAVVIGTAFTAVVTAFVDGLITPLIAEMFNADDISTATVGIFALVLPMAKLKERHDRRKGILPEEPVETDVDILHDIRDLLRAQQAPGTAPRA